MPLLERQARMLDALWPLLKPGGRMLYCTCSILKDENQDQIGKFVERQPECQAETIEADWGIVQSPGRQILTGSDNMDGFYYALLTRAAAP
jgi:16S rRNA (cytosine967-C5)-methyltransferase